MFEENQGMQVSSNDVRRAYILSFFKNDQSMLFFILLTLTFSEYIVNPNFRNKTMQKQIFFKMSTRSQNRQNNHQESIANVSENIVSPTCVENVDLAEQDVMKAAPSTAKSPRIEIVS